MLHILTCQRSTRILTVSVPFLHFNDYKSGCTDDTNDDLCWEAHSCKYKNWNFPLYSVSPMQIFTVSTCEKGDLDFLAN